MGSKIASLRGREDETIESNQRTRSVSVGGAGSSRGPTMSAPSGVGGTRPIRRPREVGLFWGMSNSAPNPGTRLSFSQHHTLWANNVKCPVCSKKLQGDDIEEHLVMCLSRPRVTYNEDVLVVDQGECDICFDEMSEGDNIARLPCLCIYHKRCIDEWFDVNRSCPKHPVD